MKFFMTRKRHEKVLSLFLKEIGLRKDWIAPDIHKVLLNVVQEEGNFRWSNERTSIGGEENG